MSTQKIRLANSMPLNPSKIDLSRFSCHDTKSLLEAMVIVYDNQKAKERPWIGK